MHPFGAWLNSFPNLPALLPAVKGGFASVTPSLRGSFADFPRREVLLYQTVADWQARRSTAIIYYLGVPDTTPEFASPGALDAYLRDALATLQGGQGRKP